LQEGFIQIWNNAGQYRMDKAKPITWMTSIFRYRALDRLAKEKKHSDQILANNNED
jgi:RNA polymerase sigma-70 factor (ECF subfamily)